MVGVFFVCFLFWFVWLVGLFVGWFIGGLVVWWVGWLIVLLEIEPKVLHMLAMCSSSVLYPQLHVSVFPESIASSWVKVMSSFSS